MAGRGELKKRPSIDL